MKKIYLSGRISGLDPEEARRTFGEASARMQAQGYDVVNPLENGLPACARWEHHMAIDIIMLLGCDAVYMMSGWRGSRGATLEQNVAEATGKEVIYEVQPSTVDAIKDVIEDETGVSWAEVCNPDRHAALVDARRMYAIMASEAGFGCSEIGKAMCRDHSTAINLIKTGRNAERYDKKFKSKIERARRALLRK